MAGSAGGPFKVVNEEQGRGQTRFRLVGMESGFELRLPGEHNVLNAAAALALCVQLWERERPDQPPDWPAASRALSSFAGSRRRSEIVGEAGGVLFMDDYAHHPTAIAKTLAGIRRFHPEQADRCRLHVAHLFPHARAPRRVRPVFRAPRTRSSSTASMPRRGRPTRAGLRARTCTARSRRTIRSVHLHRGPV